MKRFVAATVFVALSGLFLTTADAKHPVLNHVPKHPPTYYPKSVDLGPGPGVLLDPFPHLRPGPFWWTPPHGGGHPKHAIPITVPGPRARGSWQRSAPVPQPVPSPGRLYGPSLRRSPRRNAPWLR